MAVRRPKLIALCVAAVIIGVPAAWLAHARGTPAHRVRLLIGEYQNLEARNSCACWGPGEPLTWTEQLRVACGFELPELREPSEIADDFRQLGASALPELIEHLKDDDDTVRRIAAWALGEMGPAARDAVPALIAVLEDKDSGGARGCAAEALCKIGPTAKSAVPALREALKDKDSVLRVHAASALIAIGPVTESDLSVLRETVHNELEDDFGGGSTDDVARAIGNAGLGAKALIPELVKVLNDEGGDVFSSRSTAIEALGKMGPAAQAAIPTLKRQAVSALEETRPAAEVALEKIEPDPARSR